MASMFGFTYPAFFSYSHADSGAAGKYVERFHKAFSTILAGKLGQRQLQCDPPFLDKIDLPSVGSVDELLSTKVENSFALFLFVGQGYVNSQYCFNEFKYFSRRFGGAQDELRNRVWILELEPLENEIQDRFKSRLRDANAEKLWTNVRAPLYDPLTRTLISLKDNDGDVTDLAAVLLGRFAEDLANRIQKSAPNHVAVQVEFKQDVVIGAVTKDLIDVSNDLKTHLQAAGLAVDTLPDTALTELALEDLKDRFSHSRLVILPVSDAKVLIPSIPGGHIKMQIDALSGLQGTRYVMWTPPGIPPPAVGQFEQHTKHRETWGSAWNSRQVQGAAEMAADIQKKLKGSIATDDTQPEAIRVLIETRNGEDSWQFVGELLDDWWKKSFPESAKKYRLEFEGLSVTRLFEKKLDILGDGVVVLRDEDDNTLGSKCDHVSRRMKPWKEKRASFYPGLIAQIEPPDPGGPPVLLKWPIARFRLENDSLRYLTNGQSTNTMSSIEQFLRRIARWKNTGHSSVQPTR